MPAVDESSIRIVCCERPFSFFREADRYEGDSHNHALHRVFSFARKSGAKTMVAEPLSDPDWRAEETKAVAAAFPSSSSILCRRLSFFSREFSLRGALKNISPKAFLGYADVVSVRVQDQPVWCYVRQSVMSPPGLLNNYLHVQSRFEPLLCGRPFTITGSYFCQQNGVTGCCAHAALRSALTSLGVDLRTLTDPYMNRLLGIAAEQARQGLSVPQVRDIIESAGFAAFHLDFFNHPDRPYAHFVHPFVESGFPALLVLSMEETCDPLHVVAVVGHTLNTDLWYPEASLGYFVTFPSEEYSYLPSWNWLPDLIVQDDNYGMLLCLSSTCLLKQTLPRLDPRSRPKYGIGLVPKGIRRSPSNAEDRAIVLLRLLMRALVPLPDGLRWLHELRHAVLERGRAPVLRTLLVSKSRYIRHVEGSVDWEGQSFSKTYLDALSHLLPEDLWMVEVSIPNLYTANRTKLGELLIDVRNPDGDPHEDLRPCWVGGRLPGVFFIPRRGVEELPTTVSSDLEAHVAIYRRPELPMIAAEW